MRLPDGTGVGIPLCGLLLGRSRACDLVLADEDASRRHASVRVLGDRLWAIDEGSTNGTLVNGELAPRKRLETGDELLVGSTRLVLEEGDAPLPEALLAEWSAFSSSGRGGEAIHALRALAAAEDCRLDPDGVAAVNWAEGERGIDGLGPARARMVEKALGMLAGI